MLTGAVGCSRSDNSVQMPSENDDIYLSRASSASVYGVEAPAADETIVLDADISAPAQAENPEDGGVLWSAQDNAPVTETTGRTEVLAATSVSDEVRGVWVSYLTLEPLIKGKNQKQFTNAMDEVFGNIAAFGLNTVFVHARPFGDALYESEYFPWSYLLTGTEGQNPGYDPLKIMCELADAHGLRIEAWINPYRVRLPNGKPVSARNQAAKWVKAGNDAALQWNDGIYYNPGSEEARKLIVNGVREIVKNYDVDGIHFDDYFYPTTDFAFDKETYKASGSKLSQADWRRENVNVLVKEVYAAVKEIDKSCVFGISPQGNVKINYDGQFADVSKWLKNTGYVDYICPQIYYGYDNDTCPYAETVDQWDSMIKADGIDLYVGVAAYKLGQEDKWAGGGKTEWMGTKDLLGTMVDTARDASSYGGVVFYSYDSLFALNSKQVNTECDNLKKRF